MASLRGKEQELTAKYVKNPAGRIFLNNKSLCKLPEMTAINLEGFENPVPETVEKLEIMKKEAAKEPKESVELQDEPEKPTDSLTLDDFTKDDAFDYSRATKKQIAKKAKELFNSVIDVEDKDIADIRAEYVKLAEQNNDNTGAGFN